MGGTFSRPVPLVERDFTIAAALLAEAYPHRGHESSSWGRRAPNERRWTVSEGDSTVAAYLALWRVHDDRFRMDIVVQPASRRKGLGTHLLDFLIEEGRGMGAGSLQARAYAFAAPALRLLASRGFAETMRMTGLVLDDVASVFLDPVSLDDSRFTDRGVRITTLREELAHGPDAWRKLRDANYAARFGWPDPDPPPAGPRSDPPPVDEFRNQALEFGTVPEACFIATCGDIYAGYSALTSMGTNRARAGSGGTAVTPGFRGLGLATALKARCIRWAQRHGVQRLETASGNPAMVRVNERFGFRRTYEEVRLVRRPV